MSAKLSQWHVWITRTDSSAASSAAAISAAGFTPVITPLLRLSPASTPAAAPIEGCALAFTSPNGVRAFTALTDRRDWPVFTVGNASAKLATQSGFEDVVSAGGDVSMLAEIIITAQPASIVHLSGVHIAGDLVGLLTEAGIEAARTIIYATQAAEKLPDAGIEALGNKAPQAVLLYSPKGARTFLNIMRADHADSLLDLHIVSLSPAIDAVLGEAHFASRSIAAAPDEPSLIAALEIVAAKA